MESTVAGVIPGNMPCSTSVRILESLKYPCLDRLSCSWLSEELKGHCVVSYYGAVLYLVQADRRFTVILVKTEMSLTMYTVPVLTD